MKHFKKISFLGIVVFMGCQQKPGQLQKIINLPNYPSTSGLANYKNHFYLVGDDAATIWKLDTNYAKTDQLNLYNTAVKRIDKNTKDDLEAITVVQKEDTAFLILVGSGSTAQREKGWKINLRDSVKTKFSLAVFYKRLQLAGIKNVNIEGITATEQGFILANRGHLDYRMNYLIFTSPDFYKNQERAAITLVKFGFQKDSSFLGLSGLAYSSKTGHLYGTLSSEETSSSFADGAIGSSSVFILRDVLQKQRFAAINPNVQIDLLKVDKAFAKQKIESLTIVKEELKVVSLLLAADNDDGKSTLFKIELNK